MPSTSLTLQVELYELSHDAAGVPTSAPKVYCVETGPQEQQCAMRGTVYAPTRLDGQPVIYLSIVPKLNQLIYTRFWIRLSSKIIDV